MPSSAPKGFLLVLMDPPPAFEEEFNAWYDTEHLPQRMAVPGFETGRRYVCVHGAPRYLAIYDVTSPAVLESEAYLQCSLDRSTPWTKRVASRSRPYRAGGPQIYPGSALTRPSARLLLLRFRSLEAAAQQTIVSGMRESFEGRSETLQVRVFASSSEAGNDYLGVVELRAPISDALQPAAFGAHADALDLINTYAPY
ncbi:MAG: hypothetical protein C5B46_09080 [Proteobacteria bacterium]|nr:MAG: hypothetical protein C5B46_09080 [Pseudomonadota bacterium]